MPLFYQNSNSDYETLLRIIGSVNLESSRVQNMLITTYKTLYYSPISDVVKLQNKAIRVINNVPIMENITPHYVNLGILKFPDIVKLYTCLLYFDLLHDHKPSNFVIPLLSEQHSYTTRNVSSQQLYIPFYRTNIRMFSPTIIGLYFWNDLPLSIRSRHSKRLFKCSLFNHYLSQY